MNVVKSLSLVGFIWFCVLHCVPSVSMVVVLNGVLADECPTSVRALLLAHPGYRDAAAQLLGAAARVVGPAGLLYVAQRELAAAVPHDKNVTIIGSDDATSCIIVVVRHSVSFHRLSVEIDLTLACCCELNTALNGGSAAPLVTGVGVDIRAGDLFPATFPDKGPELPLRGARTITGGPNSSQASSDDFILQHLSTTPAVEPPHFVHHVSIV
ncbi:hypothetical protein MSG28_005260 [Choristoneura fumiferana]|uniref:Uncharacterized protein n=1 Tax=Choristoneura fumiferana TaxID=7141 RepID=A0ACC0JQG9_CHOFU|nr:hypothetical protein MSG28_005260 [Choristoneura fumiferana]